MITIQFRYREKSETLTLPETDGIIERTVQAIGGKTDSDFNFFLDHVLDPEELKYLEDTFVDLDELSFLAKRMDSFDEREMRRFLAVADNEHPTTLKDLINLTYNLRRYTLVDNFGDMAMIGKVHLLNQRGGLSVQELQTIDFEQIGRELIRSGRGTVTEHGLLFHNADLPFEEVYDGRNFPEYAYNSDWLVSVTLGYEGREEYLYLPVTEGVINRAVNRLGAPDTGPITVDVNDTNFRCDGMDDRIQNILREEGLEETNKTLEELKGHCFGQEDWEKLDAIARYMDVDFSGDLQFLGEHMEDFHYFAEVSDSEEVGREWLEHCTSYCLDPDLEDFFDFESYGEMITDSNEGEFLDDEEGGFVCMANDMLKSSMEAMMNERYQQMGGMQF